MFNWYSIGVAIALAAFVGVFVGYGLHCFLHDRHPEHETTGAAYDADLERHQERRAEAKRLLAAAPPADHNAVARKLLDF